MERCTVANVYPTVVDMVYKSQHGEIRIDQQHRRIEQPKE